MGTVIRNILGRMDDRQLLVVCSSIRQFMVWRTQVSTKAASPRTRESAA